MSKNYEVVVREFEFENESAHSYSVKIKGPSSMPFWHHDLTLEVVKALLETVNAKDYDFNDYGLLSAELDEITNLVDCIMF